MPGQGFKTYYYKRFIRVQSDDPIAQRILDDVYREHTTYVFCAVQVKHDMYENDAVRTICGFFGRRQVTQIMPVSAKESISSDFLGRVRVRLATAITLPVQQVEEKSINLYYARLSTSVDAVCAGILALKRVQVEGKLWTILACTGGGERVRYKADPDTQVEAQENLIQLENPNVSNTNLADSTRNRSLIDQ